MGGFSTKVKAKEIIPLTEVTGKWKLLPSVDEARLIYEADGSLAKNCDVGFLEFRALLDEPIAQVRG